MEPSLIVTGSRSCGIGIWDLRCSAQKMRFLDFYQESPYHRPNPDSKAYGALSLIRNVHDTNSKIPVTCVLFLNSQTIVSSGGYDGILKSWDIRYPCGTTKTTITTTNQSVDLSGPNTGGVCNMQYDESTDTIYGLLRNSTVFSVLGSKFQLKKMFKAKHLQATQYSKISVSVDSKYFVVGSARNVACCFHVDSGKYVAIGKNDRDVTAVSFSRQGLRLALCSDDSTVRIWDEQEKSIQQVYDGLMPMKSTVPYAYVVKEEKKQKCTQKRIFDYLKPL